MSINCKKVIEKVHQAISEVQDRMLFDSSAYKPINEVINMGNDYSIKTYMRIDGQVGMEVSPTKPVEYIKLDFTVKKTGVFYEDIVKECMQEKP
jgi:hypothetical protein